MVNLKRTDLVRIAAERLREEIAQEIIAATAGEVAARAAFTTAMLGQATARWNGVLSDVCRMVGTDGSRLRVDVLLEMTDDVVACPPTMVGVVIRDGAEWDSRLSLRCELPVDQPGMLAWVAAVKRKAAAEMRGTRTKDLDGAARAAMVDSLLTGTDAGRRVIEALKQFCTETRNEDEEKSTSA